MKPASVVVVGAGAAGLATAIFAARAAPGLDLRCLDGARTIGAKILVSGGSRCNVTNRIVTERDFWSGASPARRRAGVRHVLKAFSAEQAVRFFESVGVTLHEEEDGKLFPDSNRSRTVLDALLGEAGRLGVTVEVGHRVTGITREAHGFTVQCQVARRADGAPTEEETCHADAVVLATGGRSLPKTGSDGFGYELARRLGHRVIETTPALAPLVLRGERHVKLAGVAHDVALSLRADGRPVIRLRGPMLWTHFGISGPVALNMSRHWHRAKLEGSSPTVTMSLCPGETLESLERWWLDEAGTRPRARVATVLAARMPSAVAEAWVEASAIPSGTTTAHLSRESRRVLLRAMLETELPVEDSRGYQYAEVTAGGVPLDEIRPATMESTVCPGLYLVGEILDVDGRLGGFNFQWAWSSGWVAGQAIAKASRG